MQDGSAPGYRRRKLRFDDVRIVQELDPDAPVDDVGVCVWRVRLPRPHFLEA